MVSDDFLLEYAWIIKEFQNSNGMSLKELKERWIADKDYSKGVELNYHTFHRHLDNLAVSLGVIIEYDYRQHVYHMVNKEPLRGKEMIDFMFQAMVINKWMRELVGLEHRVSLQRFSLGEHVIKDVVLAIKKNRVIDIDYLPQKKTEITNHTVLPYGLKMYDHRIYLIGKSRDSILPFELDRIKALRITSKSFMMPADFNIHEYYFHFFGVFRDENIQPEMVVIRTFENEHRYLKELPLHHSQEEIKQKDPSYHDYKIFVSPSEDFIAKLISRQDRLVVLSPDWLVDAIDERLGKMQNLYQKVKISRGV